MAIPKIIHYCWFGRRPLPVQAQKCIDSWKRYLPDYKIQEWNEDNFNVNITNYTSDAYRAKKYAFVSDYARFWILYHFGGLYFDTDVEVIKDMSSIIDRGPFMGCENDPENPTLYAVNPGLGLYSMPKMDFYKIILNHYAEKVFTNYGGDYGDTVVTVTTHFLKELGYVGNNRLQIIAGITIYPMQYFCPKHIVNGHYVTEITEETVSIHHYSATWLPKNKLIISRCKSILGEIIGYDRLYDIINALGLNKFRKIVGL